MWPKGIQSPGRTIADLVSFIDLAPTVIEVAGLNWSATGMAPSPGRSLVELFRSEKSGRVIPERDFVLIGKERNDIGRPQDWGYPVRGIVRENEIYVHNFAPTRWPAGNPETGYLDTDAGATKRFILDARRKNGTDPFWDLCFGKRLPEEFYRLSSDPDAVNNLAHEAESSSQQSILRAELFGKLREQGDPRMEGEEQGAVFDKYPHANRGTAGFYERFMAGEKLKAGWVDPEDFEAKPIEGK
jgi:arylsulfatase A-like enzyme